MTTLEPLVFAGLYEDDRGVDPVQWCLKPAIGDRGAGFEIHAVIRGVPVSGPDFDLLEVGDLDAARAAGLPAPDVIDCRLSGRMPCTVTVSGRRTPVSLDFMFDYRRGRASELCVSLEVVGTVHQAVDKSFEECLERIEAGFPPGIRLTSCLTCRWSGYQIYTWNVMGMRCCRDAKEQHLAARDKHQENRVPVAEFVPETHLCAQYERDEEADRRAGA
ncbi:DUF6304 family protein [Streptacidiphilus melanogenes]|uniref:DUF6304 family protein n=1 Tax=Streptacidiphilus melanogenes TaxID=411235 RepID=UPI0005A7B981|nr:DUF6304 family protein [Streptacidiphilus melanogenes]